MEGGSAHGEEEIVDVEEGMRPIGPRWPEVRRESGRSHGTERAALWCRRIAGMLVWGFFGVIIFHLWQVALELMDLKLMALCLLITSSLFYVFYKRYRHIRDIGLTGVDLVRALAVDESDYVGLRGVSTKARASCVDFKFDPQAAFREKEVGCGFEPYPLERPASGFSMSSSLRGDGRKDWRQRISWPWSWRRRNSDTTFAADQAGAINNARDDQDSAMSGGGGAEGLCQDLEGGGIGVAEEGGGAQVVRAGELNPSCSICLFEYYVGEDVTLLPCGHLYHTECVDIWMRDHVDCPYCRADINVWSSGGGGGVGGGGDCPNNRPSAAATAAAAASAAAAAASVSVAAAAAAATANAIGADDSTTLQEDVSGIGVGDVADPVVSRPGTRVRDEEGNWVFVAPPVALSGEGGGEGAGAVMEHHR